jgi:hypothetical protein
MDIFALPGADLMLLMAFAKKTSLPLYQAIVVYLSFLSRIGS